MDKKSYIAMGALFLAVMGYYFYVETVVRKNHPEYDWNNQNSQLNQPQSVSSAGQATTQTEPALGLTTAPATSSSAAVVAGGSPTPPVWIGSKKDNDPDYAVGLQIAPDGAALNSAILNEFKSADEKGLYTFQEPYDSDWNSLATRKSPSMAPTSTSRAPPGNLNPPPPLPPCTVSIFFPRRQTPGPRHQILASRG